MPKKEKLVEKKKLSGYLIKTFKGYRHIIAGWRNGYLGSLISFRSGFNSRPRNSLIINAHLGHLYLRDEAVN